MTPYYPQIWAQLQRVSRFDKYAAEGAEAQVDLARTASDAFELFLSKAASYGSTETPGDAAIASASFAIDLYDSARATGVKVAAEDVATSNVEQLATVAYLDTVLKTACEKLAGDSHADAVRMRLLGREYGVALLKTLVG